MPVCAQCGTQTGFMDIREGKCGACRTREKEDSAKLASAQRLEIQRSDEAKQAAFKAAAAGVILTTEAAHNLPVTERLGLVAGERVFGLNILKDLFAEVRDIVGGRSATLERALQDARSGALTSISERAAALGADAVVGIALTHSEVTGLPGGGGMIMVVATGTAVKLEQ